MNIVAIDPGVSGSIVVSQDGHVAGHNMPQEEDGICALLQSLMWTVEPVVYIEDVGYHIAGNSAMASATFARHVGFLHGVLSALGISAIRVAPKEWQKILPPSPPRPKRVSGATDKEHRAVLAAHKRDRKKAVIDFVQPIFPDVKVTLKNADALGILLWAMRHHS
jgi:hypothetical protein